MDATLRQLRYFAAVAKHLSFTRAAEDLFVSQPALSVQIRELERTLGVQLLERTSRSVALTDAGRALRDDLAVVLADLDQALVRAKGIHSGSGERLRLTYTPSVAYEALPVILDRLSLDPLMDVSTTQAWCSQAVDDVRAGRVELGLVREFDGADGVTTQVIRQEPVAVFMSDEHPLAGSGPLPVEALRDHAILVVPQELAPGFHTLATRLCQKRGFTPRLVVLDSPESREPLLAHLRRHPDQVFLGPRSMSSLEWPGVVHVPIAAPDAHLDLCLLARDGPRRPVVTRAIDAIREGARDAGWLDTREPAHRSV